METKEKKTEKQKKQEESRHRIRQIAFATGIPLRLLSGPVVGFGLGYLVDKGLGTLPIFSMILGILGFAAGVKSLIDAVK